MSIWCCFTAALQIHKRAPKRLTLTARATEPTERAHRFRSVPCRAGMTRATRTCRHAPRGRNIPDLLIAAVAQARSLVVLHYDADFDHIAAVTHQPTEWIVPRGSLD
ncbi:MAG: PIN domain-containing protein [Ornithinimicrobium sp.]